MSKYSGGELSMSSEIPPMDLKYALEKFKFHDPLINDPINIWL